VQDGHVIPLALRRSDIQMRPQCRPQELCDFEWSTRVDCSSVGVAPDRRFVGRPRIADSAPKDNEREEMLERGGSEDTLDSMERGVSSDSHDESGSVSGSGSGSGSGDDPMMGGGILDSSTPRRAPPVRRSRAESSGGLSRSSAALMKLGLSSGPGFSPTCRIGISIHSGETSLVRTKIVTLTPFLRFENSTGYDLLIRQLVEPGKPLTPVSSLDDGESKPVDWADEGSIKRYQVRIAIPYGRRQLSRAELAAARAGAGEGGSMLLAGFTQASDEEEEEQEGGEEGGASVDVADERQPQWSGGIKIKLEEEEPSSEFCLPLFKQGRRPTERFLLLRGIVLSTEQGSTDQMRLVRLQPEDRKFPPYVITNGSAHELRVVQVGTHTSCSPPPYVPLT